MRGRPASGKNQRTGIVGLMLVKFSGDPKPELDEEWDCQPYEVKVPKLST